MAVDDVLKEVGDIYNLVSSIPVQGDAVEVVAMVRVRLRKLNGELINLKKSSEENVSEKEE